MGRSEAGSWLPSFGCAEPSLGKESAEARPESLPEGESRAASIYTRKNTLSTA
jgi:hypothetical protein